VIEGYTDDDFSEHWEMTSDYQCYYGAVEEIASEYFANNKGITEVKIKVKREDHIEVQTYKCVQELCIFTEKESVHE
jgi:hypothetical protein